MCLEEEEIKFSMDVEKMLTKLRREEVEKEVKVDRRKRNNQRMEEGGDFEKFGIHLG